MTSLFRVKYFVVTAILFLSPLAVASSVGNETWTGSYTCGATEGGATLTLHRVSGDEVSGTFDFYALPGRPLPPHGNYNVQGTLVDGVLRLSPGSWNVQPPGYINPGISGTVSADNNILTGSLTSSGCTFMRLTRADSSAVTQSPELKQATAPAAKKTATESFTERKTPDWMAAQAKEYEKQHAYEESQKHEQEMTKDMFIIIFLAAAATGIWSLPHLFPSRKRLNALENNISIVEIKKNVYQLPAKKNITIHEFTGKVVEVNSESTTHVSGMVYKGYGGVSSKVKKKVQVWLRDEAGREERFEFGFNLPFATRTGHNITFFWMSAEGLAPGPVVMAICHNEKQKYWVPPKNDTQYLDQLGLSKFKWTAVVLLLLFFSGIGILFIPFALALGARTLLKVDSQVRVMLARHLDKELARLA